MRAIRPPGGLIEHRRIGRAAVRRRTGRTGRVVRSVAQLHVAARVERQRIAGAHGDARVGPALLPHHAHSSLLLRTGRADRVPANPPPAANS